MQTKDCILTRRSVRQFEERTLPHTVLEQVIEQASYAPSWKNSQISRYIAIENRMLLDEICTHYVKDNNAEIIRSAPVLIVQTFIAARSGFERDGTHATDRKDGWQHFDCGIAAQTLCLAAHDMGLGTVIVGIFDRLGLQAFLNIPPQQELMALIPIGYPAQTPGAPARKTVEQLLTYQ